MKWVAVDQIRHILVPLVEDRPANLAIEYSNKLATCCGARVTVLQDQTKNASPKQFEGFDAFARLHDALTLPLKSTRFTPTFSGAQLRQVATDDEFTLRHQVVRKTNGDFLQEVIRFCRQESVDLVVAQGDDKQWFPWLRRTSFADLLQPLIDCPIVVVARRWRSSKQRNTAGANHRTRERIVLGKKLTNACCSSIP